jgi:AcrR family transcriptional regulator
MNRKRLTRQDSREETRQHLLDAAQRLIAKKGLSTASVEDIAEAAGYTRGAFYSNFGSKDDLFLELLRRDHNETHVQLAAGHAAGPYVSGFEHTLEPIPCLSDRAICDCDGHTEEPMDRTGVSRMRAEDARFTQPSCVRLTLITQRVELRRDDQRRRQATQILSQQRRSTWIAGISRIA